MNTIVQGKAPLRRRVVRPLLGVLASLLLAATVNMISIWLIGDVSGWSRWLHEHSGHFAVWRGLLYGATSFGWLWMRNRVLRRGNRAPSHESVCFGRRLRQCSPS